MKDFKILVVDDFDTMIRIIKNILEELGYTNIVTARNGEFAYKILTDSAPTPAQKIDFIVSDWNMPKMTGLELLVKVRENPALADTPFLMVTAEAEKRHIVEAVKAKVSQYIIKPFTAEMLKEKIELAIKNQEQTVANKKN